jgi:hypothetical protein
MTVDPAVIRHVVRFLHENSAPNFAGHVTEMAEEITRLRDALARLACAGEEDPRVRVSGRGVVREAHPHDGPDCSGRAGWRGVIGVGGFPFWASLFVLATLGVVSTAALVATTR